MKTVQMTFDENLLVAVDKAAKRIGTTRSNTNIQIYKYIRGHLLAGSCQVGTRLLSYSFLLLSSCLLASRDAGTDSRLGFHRDRCRLVH